jgi:putative phosphoribosyl transferase
MTFKNRADAGAQLGEALLPYAHDNALILGLPRGGVIVAYEVARKLNKPLDVLTVRKVGAPGQPELAVGAVAPEGVIVWNHGLLRNLNLDIASLDPIVEQECRELERRQHVYRGDRPFPNLIGVTAILVDDGLATGATARAAIQSVRALKADRIVLAIPVASRSAVSALRHEVDELVCLETPESFEAVSQWYASFPQNTDSEVIALLRRAWAMTASQISDMARSEWV